MGHWEFKQEVNGMSWFYKEDKMKIIDLEYLLANGKEVPLAIIYEDEIYKFKKNLNDYENEYADFEEGLNKYRYLFENPYGKDYVNFFNDEVEILEDSKKENGIMVNEKMMADVIESLDAMIGYADDGSLDRSDEDFKCFFKEVDEARNLLNKLDKIYTKHLIKKGRKEGY